MELAYIAEKYDLPPEVCEFMQQYGYEAAQKNFCWPPEEISGDRLKMRCQSLALADVLPELEAALARTAGNEPLQRVLHYIFYYWYKLENVLIYYYKLPDLDKIVPEDAGLLHLAIAIAGCDAIEKKFAAMKLPARYAAAALQRIPENSTLYFQQYGHWGFPESGLHWMRFFVEGSLFRLGRFEYMIEDAQLKVAPLVYKHKVTGKIAALCQADWRLNSEGYTLWRDIPDEEPYCITTLEETAEYVRGTPVDPAGFAVVDKTLTLDKSEYAPLWQPGDLVPDMHIPPGGNMRLDLCRESLQEALEFFPEYIGKTPKAFVCFSWIFNPDFKTVLPESNLSKFMNELYLTPFSCTSLAGLSFVFGKEDKDWSHYPANNSLQKAFHQLRQNNRRLKEGGMFIEADGIKNFGTQYYLRDSK